MRGEEKLHTELRHGREVEGEGKRRQEEKEERRRAETYTLRQC